MKAQVLALPGGVMPAALRYASLQAAVRDDAELHIKDLEVYAADEPPPEYSIQRELAALTALADSLKLQRFHLVGYSGGGFVSLAFAGLHPERLLSLAVFEPARIPGQLTPAEAELDRRLDRALAGKTGAEFMRAFVEDYLRDGVEAPPASGPPPPWMGKRPAGLSAMLAAFRRFEFDREQLRRCEFPVLYAYGDQTAGTVELQAAVLGRLLPDVHILRFAGIHHFVAPEQIYTREHVSALRALWRS